MNDTCRNCTHPTEDYRHAYCDDCWQKYVDSEYELCNERGCLHLIPHAEYEARNGKCDQHREAVLE